MVRHESLDIWEHKLKSIFDKIDDFLEEKYGKLYELHPRRAKVGKTSNKEHDGLFNIGASYSLGFGSKYGAGISNVWSMVLPGAGLMGQSTNLAQIVPPGPKAL